MLCLWFKEYKPIVMLLKSSNPLVYIQRLSISLKTLNTTNSFVNVLSIARFPLKLLKLTNIEIFVSYHIEKKVFSSRVLKSFKPSVYYFNKACFCNKIVKIIFREAFCSLNLLNNFQPFSLCLSNPLVFAERKSSFLL